MELIDYRRIEDFFNTSGSEIYKSVSETIAKESMAAFIEGGVLVGLSGGADSVILLCFLLEYRRRSRGDFNIVACHVNHGIRGDEADRDEVFCKSLCQSFGVEFISKAFCVPEIAKAEKCSIEESARIVRYSVFNTIISGRNDLTCIAVAHNMSDSTETTLFNILRGCGARGASGIRPVRDNIIRPLISVSKDSIHSSLDEFGIAYVTDSTNLSTDYTRNYIRHEILPSLSKVTSDPERMIARFSENMRCDDDYISSVADSVLRENKPLTNKILASLHYSVYIRVLSLLADKAGASVSHRIASDIHALLSKDHFSYSLIGGAEFICENGVCRVSRDTHEGFDYCFAINEGINDLSPFNAILVLSKDKKINYFSNVYKKSIQANLSSAIIKGNLYLRPKKDGDTVYYGKMTHKIKKLFSDAKIPRSKRRLIPILCDDSGVVWVPGFGVRDDGVPKDQRVDNFVLLAIKNDNLSEENNRLYSGSEFRT